MASKLILLSLSSILIIIVGSFTVLFLLQQSTDSNNVELDTQFSLKIGQSATLLEQRIVLIFIDVLKDSRCPSDVTCFWEGTVTIALNIFFEGKNLGEFGLNSSNLHKASFRGFYVKLEVLDPYPVSTEIIQKSDYNGTFIIGEYGPD